MGLLIAGSVITLWLAALGYSLSSLAFSFSNPFSYLFIALNTFLYTGLFITAHDAMHGTVSGNKFINHAIGRIACFLFAGFSYNQLRKKHYLHHGNPTGETDPDYGHGSDNFLLWFFRFIKGYATLRQFILMALLYNLLSFFFGEKNVVSFWLIPSVLSSLQLFYFGTYLPHRNPESGLTAPHFARSQKRNHIYAFLSCYFFGYHHEHHSSPATPWWKLHKLARH